MMNSHTYAKMDMAAVKQNTGSSRIFRVSELGMTITHMANIINILNAADPTIVAGPSSPASKLFPTISIIDRRISGADEPSAIRVRLATVHYQQEKP